ncbi:MAG: phage tail tape measure protein, partial [Anaerolineales bacterium]
MATKLGDAYVEIGSRLGLLTSGLARAKGMVTGAMGAIVGTVGRAMDAMKRAAGIGGLGLAGAAGLGIKKFADFEEAMAKVATLLGREAMPQMERLTKQVRALSTEFGLSGESIASALFDVLSAGYEVDKAMRIVGEGARVAVAGFTDIDVVMAGLLTTMKGYEAQVRRIGDVSNTLYAISQKARMTYQELAVNIGQVSSVAASYNVSLAELGAVLSSIITRSGFVTESFTRMRMLLMAIAAPTIRQTKYIAEYGIKLGSARLAAEGLIPILADLKKLTPEAMRRVLGAQEATMAVQFVKLADLPGLLEDIRKSGGLVGEALAKAMDTTSFKLRRLKQQVNDTLRSIGGFFVNLWNEVSSDLRAVGAVLWAAWAKPLQRIAGAAGNLVETIRKLFLRAWDAILERLVNIDIPVRKVLAIVRAGWRDIGVGMQWVEDSLKTVATNVWMLIKQTVRVIWSALKPLGLAIMLAHSKAAMAIPDALIRPSREAGWF